METTLTPRVKKLLQEMNNARFESLDKWLQMTNLACELERKLLSSEAIRKAEKKILIDEIAAHTATKEKLADLEMDMEAKNELLSQT